jgi:hypothetical protein
MPGTLVPVGPLAKMSRFCGLKPSSKNLKEKKNTKKLSR